jgi:hypothetical protein
LFILFYLLDIEEIERAFAGDRLQKLAIDLNYWICNVAVSEKGESKAIAISLTGKTLTKVLMLLRI